MKKTKRIAITALCSAMAFSSVLAGGLLANGMHSYSADAEEGETTYYEDKEWVKYAGSPSATYDMENGYTNFEDMSAYGARMYYSYKVKLNGLSVYLESDDLQSRSIFGFSLAKNAGDYGPDGGKGYWTYNATVWPGSTVASQTRVVSSVSHNPNAGYMIGYKTAADAIKSVANTSGGCDDAVSTFYSSVVYSNLSGELGAKFTFSLVEDVEISETDENGETTTYTDDCWCVTIETTRGEKHSQQPASVKVYVNKRYMDCVLDENGECYVISYGWADSTSKLVPVYEMKLEDDNIRAYQSGALAEASAAETAYSTAIQAVSDLDTYNTSVSARATLVEKITALRGNDQTVYNLKLAELDKLYTEDATVQENVKAALQTTYTAAQEKIAVLETEANINDESLAEAQTALNTANGAYESMENMLTEENKTYFTGLTQTYTYSITLAKAKSWVISFEAKVAALEDAEMAELVDMIVELKAVRAAYEGSSYETIVTEQLTAEDRTALEARIAAADAALAQTEETASSNVKDYYLSVLEEALEEDLTIKYNIDDAKTAYFDLTAKVEITSEDGELYTRYTAAYATLKTACESYELGEIQAVAALLEQEYTTYNAFSSVRNRYYAINLSYLLEENAEIEAAYDAVTAAIRENVFFNVTTTSLSEVTQNTTGLYFEQTPVFPSRLNYNEKLDLREGATVVVELTEAAFYNDGSSANNLCFNFLLAPNSYKSINDGISVIIWLYATESNVQIYNHNDTPLASASIATPIDGGTLTITVMYGDYYDFIQDETYAAYQIKVNEAQIVLTEAQLTQYGYEVGTDVYFSMGSFADKTENPNCMTLVSVNDVSFGYVEQTPDEPDNPVTPDNPDDPDNPDNPVTPDNPANPDDPDDPVDDPNDNPEPENPDNGEDTKKGGCGTISFGGWGGGIALGIIAVSVVLVFTVRRKKTEVK